MPKATNEHALQLESYSFWKRVVDRRLHKVYCITIEDTGVDDEMLKPHWEMKQLAHDFVDWFGEKYDLDRISDYQF